MTDGSVAAVNTSLQPRRARRSSQRFAHVDAADHLERLIAKSAAVGWPAAVFEDGLRDAQGADAVVEDLRALDWTFLLDLRDSSTALVLGCGFGMAPCAVAARVQSVYALERREREHGIALVRLQARQQGINNLRTMLCRRAAELPFQSGTFDLVATGGWLPTRASASAAEFRTLAAAVRPLLRPGGTAQFLVRNRISPARVLTARLGGQQAAAFSLTARSCRKTLQDLGYSVVRLYAPLPLYDRAPLMYLPLESRPAIEGFLKDCFASFDLVSPEVKRRYRFELRLARMAVAVMRRARLAHLLESLVPGFCVLASVETSSNTPGEDAAGAD